MNLTCTTLDCGRKLENPEKTHANTGRTCKTPHRRTPKGPEKFQLVAVCNFTARCCQMAVDAVGEILLSLSYLPTAERLTVVCAKCKNLVWTNSKNTADPFVKVYLLQDGKKISKKKTSTKRDDTNPIFNEAMIFSVPSIVLQELSLRVTVAEATEDGRGENLGHVIIGPEASGMGITHWNQMLATLRKPVSMWHPLRRI